MEHDLEMTNVTNEEINATTEPTQAAAESMPKSNEVETLLQVISEKVKAGTLPEKAEMDRLTALIYRKPQVATADEDEEHEEQDLDEAPESGVEDALIMRFINLQTRYKELRHKANEELKKQLEENLKVKTALLSRMKDLLTSTEDFGKIKTEFRKIREEWSQIGDVPQNEKAEVLKMYQEQMEQFYEINAITNEFREYDFAKNKEEKTHLIERAKALGEEPDVIKAFNELQGLHDRWKETGPVAYDDREPMWREFKQASTVVNKRHQDHFTALRAKEVENLEAKTALCERIEALSANLPDSREGWRKFMDEINALKEEWRGIGFAPKKHNNEIYQRFKTTLNDLYSKRRTFLKELSIDVDAKLEKYRKLTEQAVALKDSKEWKKTTEKIVKLQEEWKAVGGLGTRVAEATRLWHTFSDACNAFFKTRHADFKEKNAERMQNLKAKQEIIAKLEALRAEPTEDLQDDIEALQEEWQALGHVPNKNKDEINDAYYGLIRELQRNAKRGETRGGGKKSSFDQDLSTYTPEQLSDEQRRLTRIIGRIEEEIKQYEKNMWFFQPTGEKKVNPLTLQIQRKIDNLKADIKRFEERVADIKSRQKGE
ncbi:DUF349 domain-containing protein [Porphyromonas sp.]|uniref:DUF349 domain-containing protein n=1 Tax=Porphyromonas sp. TaxID=1924944 RepID=UPI0026DD475D|nr:DUF349 domain-containing protein [Porphyromonas sp.]MDO4770621.1 DUF349 domain-containing protein [Porphyromonas sp.]